MSDIYPNGQCEYCGWGVGDFGDCPNGLCTHGPWADLADEERCDECGQPDNCGDCDHEPLSPTEVQALLGA